MQENSIKYSNVALEFAYGTENEFINYSNVGERKRAIFKLPEYFRRCIIKFVRKLQN